MALVDRISSGIAELRQRDAQLSLNDWADYFAFGGNSYPIMQTTMGSIDRESIGANAVAGFKGNGPIFSLVLARLQAFSQVRFQWTRFQGSQPTDLFGTPELAVLERPWPGGTTSDLLARMEIHASVAGCAYVIRPKPDRLSILRPDRVTIVMGSQAEEDDPSEAPDVEIAGFVHTTSHGKMTFYGPDEVAYYAPIPDPDYRFLGMSWITPVIRDLQADSLATEHKARFFTNAAPQPLDAKILTPTGWSTMGAMRIGSQVIGADGKPHAVTGVYPQGERDIYEVQFADGTSAECTLDHVWTVSNNYDRRRGATRNMTLADLLADGFHYRSGPAKWAVPMVEPVEYDEPADLPVDPYLLGLLLGDGSFRGNRRGSGAVTLTCHADDVDETIERISLPAGVGISRRDCGGWSELYLRAADLSVVRDSRGRIVEHQGNPLTNAIKTLGLWDLAGPDKYVPSAYLSASVKDRIALLQGLIDSDGHVAPTALRFTTTSLRLANGLVELVGSLGGVATIRANKGRSTLTVNIRQLPDWIIPAQLLRKADAYRPTGALRVRTIVGAKLVRRAQAQCIAVDSVDHLYVTDDFVVTHNTPNMAIKFDASVSFERVKLFKELLESEHKGAFNAWKTLYLGGGADPVTIGSSFKDMDYAAVQGRAESRLAAAAGVPPSWVGFAEGLQGSSLNAGNFNSARRRFSDGTMIHLWTNAATSLEVLLGRPPGASLWFDSRVPFMREDAEDLAAIQEKQAQTIVALVKDGFTPESAVAAVTKNDFNLLVHSGLLSVQLQPPGAGTTAPNGNSAPSLNGNGKVAVGG